MLYVFRVITFFFSLLLSENLAIMKWTVNQWSSPAGDQKEPETKLYKLLTTPFISAGDMKLGMYPWWNIANFLLQHLWFSLAQYPTLICYNSSRGNNIILVSLFVAAESNADSLFGREQKYIFEIQMMERTVHHSRMKLLITSNNCGLFSHPMKGKSVQSCGVQESCCKEEISILLIFFFLNQKQIFRLLRFSPLWHHYRFQKRNHTRIAFTIDTTWLQE